MTHSEIVQDVMDQLNLTSDTARDRVGRRVNEWYAKLTSSLGLQTSRLVIQDLTIDPTDPDSTLPDYDVNMEKILRIQLLIDGTKPKFLPQKTYDYVTLKAPVDALPKCWAPKVMAAKVVTITFDNFPDDEEFDVRIQGYRNFSVLQDDDLPAFPESYHKLLYHGALVDEYLKMEKKALADDAQAKYDLLLSDLRMFIAKTAYLEIAQGRDKPGAAWLGTGLNQITPN